jgi:DNA-binding transcriptional LysR family regulator
MELRQLRYFVALGEELHFGRAAERLHISQPPLSQQIARLERDLGVTLVRRSSRKVELTAAGELFLAEARRTLSQVEYAAHVARRASDGEAGRVRVGFVPVCGVMPGIVGRFLRRHPAVQLTLSCMRTVDQLDCIAQGSLDVGFVHLPIHRPALSVHEVQSHPLIVALPCGTGSPRSDASRTRPLQASRSSAFRGSPRPGSTTPC